MASGWLSTDCFGETVIARLSSIIAQSNVADLANIAADPKLVAKGITTVDQLKFAVDVGVSACLNHQPSFTVVSQTEHSYTLGEQAHLVSVRVASEKVSGDASTHKWGDCLEELGHGGDTGTGRRPRLRGNQGGMIDVTLQFDMGVEQLQDNDQVAKIMEFTRWLDRNNGRGPPSAPAL